MNDTQALSLAVSYLLDNATPESTWGDYQVDWNPIITALTCKLLLSCGLTPTTIWYVNHQGYHPCTLASSFAWLNNSILPDGNFGTDFWDAAQLGILIETYSLQSYFTGYESLKTRLHRLITSNHFCSDSSQWQGPAFYACAISYLRLLGEEDRAKRLSHNLAKLHHDGCWQGQAGVSGIPFAVWHTAQCLLLLAENPDYHPEALALGQAWLVKAQHESGAWVSIQQYNVYFTAYAVLALLHDRISHEQEIRRGLDYLEAQMAVDGKCSDLGGTLMCALALRAAVGDAFENELTLIDYLLSRKNITRAEASEAALATQGEELARVKSELAKYEAKYSNAELVVTKRAMFVLALAALFIAIIGTLGPPLIEHMFSSPQISTPQQISVPEKPTPTPPSTEIQKPSKSPPNQPDASRKITNTHGAGSP